MQCVRLFSVMFLFSTLLEARISQDYSLIVYPRNGQYTYGNPLVVGLVLNVKGGIVNREPIMITLDSDDKSIALTDSRGIFSYRLRSTEPIFQGMHVIAGHSVRSGIMLRGSRFKADGIAKPIVTVPNGRVSAEHSAIFYPNHDCIRLKTPTIVGGVFDVDGNPVFNEAITVSIDDVAVALINSDENGLFAYTITSEQGLDEGKHTVAALCGNSLVTLKSNQFFIDTVAPTTPIIGLPDPGSIVKGNTVSVSGFADPNVRVLLFFDNSEAYEVALADCDGKWSIPIHLDNGYHTVEAYAQDCGGNRSSISLELEFTVVS